MYRPSLALLSLLFLCAVAHGQTLARGTAANTDTANEGTADQVLTSRAMLLLKRLDDDVIVYRSLEEFQESGQLARVSLDDFKSHLREAILEFKSISSSLSDHRLRNEMASALASYREGGLWWERLYEPRVIQASLTTGTNRTSADTFLLANTPFTIAIYWRQAHNYFQRAMRQWSRNPD